MHFTADDTTPYSQSLCDQNFYNCGHFLQAEWKDFVIKNAINCILLHDFSILKRQFWSFLQFFNAISWKILPFPKIIWLHLSELSRYTYWKARESPLGHETQLHLFFSFENCKKRGFSASKERNILGCMAVQNTFSLTLFLVHYCRYKRNLEAYEIA